MLVPLNYPVKQNKLHRQKWHYKYTPGGYVGCNPPVRVSEMVVYLAVLYTCKPLVTSM